MNWKTLQLNDNLFAATGETHRRRTKTVQISANITVNRLARSDKIYANCLNFPTFIWMDCFILFRLSSNKRPYVWCISSHATTNQWWFRADLWSNIAAVIQVSTVSSITLPLPPLQGPTWLLIYSLWFPGAQQPFCYAFHMPECHARMKLKMCLYVSSAHMCIQSKFMTVCKWINTSVCKHIQCRAELCKLELQRLFN